MRTDETHPGTLAFLQRDFMKAPFTAKATVVSSFPRVIDTVADSPGGVGYVRIREITESPILSNNHRFKVISLRRSKAVLAVYPNRKTVADHSYPLLRPYFVYYSSAIRSLVSGTGLHSRLEMRKRDVDLFFAMMVVCNPKLLETVMADNAVAQHIKGVADLQATMRCPRSTWSFLT